MAWRDKQLALEKRFSTCKDSYHHLPALLETIQSRNPGTIIDIEDYINEKGDSVLKRAFWSFGCMIHASKHCRPLLCVDGTFLTAQYRGTLLTAIGVDGNNQVVPIAFALVESENSESWLWFLKLLKRALVEGRENVSVLHDHNAGLLIAVQKLKNDTDPDVQWPDIQSR